MATVAERIDLLFRWMRYEELTDSQHDLIISFEEQYKARGSLTSRQLEILEDIFRQANEK